MEVHLHTDTEDFLSKCGPLLEEHEVENGLMLGLVLRNRENSQLGLHAPIVLLSVVEGGNLLTAAIQTPPQNLILSRMSLATTQSLAQFLVKHQIDFPGIVGPKQVLTQFTGVWESLTGQPGSLEIQTMIYRLDRVQPPSGVSGECRIATKDDLEIVAKWRREFAAATLPSPGQSNRADDLKKSTHRIEKGEIFLWEDQGNIVSMAGTSGPTRNGIRINAVYTPPELRGKGYASANVAAVSQRQLDNGRSFCFLYTDAGNPTSNKIYQQIGYRYVCDSGMYRMG